MKFSSLTELINHFGRKYQTVDLSGYRNEKEKKDFEQVFAYCLFKANLFYYFEELKPDGILGRREFVLAMTSTKNIFSV